MMAKDQIDDIPGMDTIEEKDLDQYGVWVNTESAEDEAGVSGSDILDIEEDNSSSGADDLGDLNDLLLSIDEENDSDDTIYLEDDVMSLDLDDDPDNIVLDSNDSSSTSFDDLGADIEIPSLDGEEITISLDDEELKIPDMDEESFEVPSELSLEEDVSGLDSLSLEEEALPEGLEPPAEDVTSFSEESLDDLDLDLPDIDSSNDFDTISFEEPAGDSAGSGDLPGTEMDEMDLESTLDLDEDLVIQDGHSPLEAFEEENNDESMIIEEMESAALPGSGAEKDFGTDELLVQSSDSLPELELDEDLVIDEEIRLKDDQDTDSAVFDDVSAVTEEFFDDEPEPEPEAAPEPVSAPAAGPTETGAGTTVLLSIEKELSAIRNELTDLRSELKRLREKGPEQVALDLPPGPADEAPAPMEADSAEKSTGFFEDEEDETIALTGDELDNILNSAEFTEEAGEPSQVDDDIIPEPPFQPGEELEVDTAEHAGQVVEEPVLPFEESASGSVPPIEEITLEEMGDTSSSLSIDEEISLEGETGPETSNEIESMANLDIEKELAGIDDLSDGESDIELYTHEEIADIEIEIPGDIDLDEGIHGVDTLNLGSEPMNPKVPEPFEESEISVEAPVQENLPSKTAETAGLTSDMPYNIKQEIKAVLRYMDQLLDALPQEKISDFAKSEHFETYRKLFEELGI